MTGLLEELEKTAARGSHRLARSWHAWPRVLALFRLVHQGSHHQALPVHEYGGELFAPGSSSAEDGMNRALAVFETAAFDHEILPDRDVHRMLERVTRTKVKIRQGRASTWVPAPVDFSDLSSEYIGILYEGLLDFELKTAPAGDPVIFLSVGDQPALPLSRLEAMDDQAVANLLEKMKEKKKTEEQEEGGEEEQPEEEEAEDETDEEEEPEEAVDMDTGDQRHATRTRAETWARRAVDIGGLAKKPRGTLTPEKRLAYEAVLGKKARQLVTRVVLPGEMYLVRWGGTRKGAGTFYTRPGLAVPTVQRTLRPLAFTPPAAADGTPDQNAPAAAWIPKTPEEILALKVCDPACGSGTFPVAALRFLTEALYASLHHHARVTKEGERAVVRLFAPPPPGAAGTGEELGQELLPCPPEDPLFEPRLKAILRRYVVERSIYGVDLDPLAVELCRLALWIETMDRSLPFSFLDHKVKCGNALLGSWFDQFQHYPAMAWKNREGGDKNHANGVHFAKEARTKAIKDFSKVVAADLADALVGQLPLYSPPQTSIEKAHAEARATLGRMHDLSVQDSAGRLRLYQSGILDSPACRSLKEAMDLWCACWFWPGEDLDHAPLPSRFATPGEETCRIARRVAAEKRFFHWELEFPDVFKAPGSGFDAVLGNPPWDIAKPNSKEFFSNIDPLYRTYGKQDALRYQTEYFGDEKTERAWLDYNADFRAQSNAMGYLAAPFGDPENAENNSDRFTIARGKDNDTLHARWRSTRALSRGFADPAHPFRHQGSADLNLYKAFLEQAHALLREGGRLGFIVPSGIYSDHGTGALRRLFLDHCRWEWLFNFINWNAIFPSIYYRFKFNTLIVEKGGTTEAINTAFVRTRLEDWESAEKMATPYTRAQVDRFSPRSKAILEIQSGRDLEILEKIYANSVLLGDDGPEGWGIKYATEFHMTNDSKLFPPRPKWEAEGYRPDEYSRWLKGRWRPIAELWADLGLRPLPPGERRCAQPPYDTLPLPRADLPPGILLSREADAWIQETQIEDTALPLYEGRMVTLYDFSEKAWVSGKGRRADWQVVPWETKGITPQYLMGKTSYATSDYSGGQKLGFLAVGSGTNSRSMFCSVIPDFPCGNSVATLRFENDQNLLLPLLLRLASFLFDYVLRMRLAGLNLNYFVVEETPLFKAELNPVLVRFAKAITFPTNLFSPSWLAKGCAENFINPWKKYWALTQHERARIASLLDVFSLFAATLNIEDIQHLFKDCDWAEVPTRVLNPKGFWRVDKDKDPELRHTVLTLVAFHDLEEKIRQCGGDREKGIEAFLTQNDGEGWMLPETLRLADYGLGHEERARHPQPVAGRLGPRFYAWQLAQSAEESWKECHLHARNLLGEPAYRQLLADLQSPEHQEKSPPQGPPSGLTKPAKQGKLFS